jgi:hypothetical protein
MARSLGFSLSLALVLSLVSAGCTYHRVRREVVEPGGTRTVAVQQQTTGGGQVVVGGGAATQLLYLPTSDLPLHLVSGIVIQTSDGRTMQLTAADLMQLANGYVAVRVPVGITTGQITVYLSSGQQYSTTFHIAVSSTGEFVGTLGTGYAGDPRCTLPNGQYFGNITSDQYSRATAWIEVGADCRSVRGIVHLQSSDGGSVDSTIEGTWDPSTYTLIARDTQLFNVQPGPNGGFCPTDRYELQLSGDGSIIQGANIITDRYCGAGSSPVYLQRTR